MQILLLGFVPLLHCSDLPFLSPFLLTVRLITVRPKLNVTLAQPDEWGCGLSEGSTVTLTARFPSADPASTSAGDIAATPAASVTAGMIRTGCMEPEATYLDSKGAELYPWRRRGLAQVGVSPDTPPPASALLQALLVVRSPLADDSLVQAVLCSKAVIQLFPLYMNGAVRWVRRGERVQPLWVFLCVS